MPQAASAVDCRNPLSAYESAGPPGSGAANDPLFGKQWGLDQINAPQAWARGARGARVTIAMLDTGVDFTHPDLKAKLLPGKELALSTADGLTGPGCPGPQDENGHGTHTAGIAAAVTNNGIGVAGTAPAAKILPVRVLDANGSGEDKAVNDGIRWAADHGAKVINLSLGGDPLLGNLPGASDGNEGAVRYALSKGAVVIASAGNESAPLCDYPAAAANAICVAATDRNENPPFYSNFPADPDGTVAVRAPGGDGLPICDNPGDIWSTMWPDAPDACGATSGYETFAGTSMAAPFVSGVAALLAGKGLSAPQILQCLKTKSSNDGGYDPIYGYGIVDAGKAVAACTPRGTPAFPPGGNAGKRHVKVTVSYPSRKKLAENGRIAVSIRTDTSVTVRLGAAVVRSGGKATKGAAKKVRLKQAGTRRTTLKLSEKARNALASHKNAKLRVRYSGGGESGVAKRKR